MSGYPEKRRFERRVARFRVNYTGGGTFFSDYCRNLSEGGIQLGSMNPLEAGTRLKLSLFLPSRPHPLEVEGEVIWSHPVAKPEEEYLGVGVRFAELDPLSKQILRTTLRDLPQLT